MLGLIGNYRDLINNVGVVPGKNSYAVNLKPYDIVEDVTPSKQYPDGKKTIPAATQEEFQKILDASPGMAKQIGVLQSHQEKEDIKCLENGCSWYQKQNPKVTPTTSNSSTPSKT